MTHRRSVLSASAIVLSAVLSCTAMLRAQEAAPFSPQGLDALAAHATLHTDMTFDASMLQAASPILPEEDRPILAKLRSISVHSFRYSAEATYDPAALESVRAQFAGHGWNHLVTKQTHPPAEAAATVGIGPVEAAAPEAPAATKAFDPTRTDVWVRMDHGDFDGVVLLVANERNINVVVIDGTISPLDLLHLRGHFGIPRFGGDGLE